MNRKLVIKGLILGIAAPLFLAGTLGMVALLAQAMTPLFTWMLPVYAALIMAIYGFVWVRFGNLLTRHESNS